MKYLLLIYSNPETWEHPLFMHDPAFLALPQAEREELIGRWKGLHRQITESGELVVGVALADPHSTRTVRVRDGVPATTDGPYAETKEHLAGYLVVDCANEERAREIAASIPDARFAAVELHPITETSLPGRGAADDAVTAG
jgi:hypothetical protein